MIDHLIIASPTLQAGVDFIEKKLGVRPVFGGKHVGRGTHNALLALGENSYLEVIAPDPAQNISAPLWMQTHLAKEPQLWTWAAKSSNLSLLEKKAKEHKTPLGEIENGSRNQPNGNLLQWQLTAPISENENGLLPFFIDWENSAHPSKTLPQAGKILEFKIFHPDPSFLKNQYEILDLNLTVEKSERKFLEATIQNLDGRVVKI